MDDATLDRAIYYFLRVGMYVGLVVLVVLAVFMIVNGFEKPFS